MYYLTQGRTYYVVVWTPYFSYSYDWNWFLDDPVPFTVGDWVTPPDPQFLLGDVNNDEDVTIADVSALIDYLLSGDGTTWMLLTATALMESPSLTFRP